MSAVIDLPIPAIAQLCREHGVKELSLFGSALTREFSASSDFDFLVEFDPGSEASLLTLISLQQDLEDLLGRKVDLVSKGGLRPLLSVEILRKRQVLYEA